MKKKEIKLSVLVLEDSAYDYELLCDQLTSAGYLLDVKRVETEQDFRQSLQQRCYDIILSDFTLPGFDAFAALKISNELCPHIPFICVSGSIGEETAIELLKQGAVDYVLKDRPGRLPFAVKLALEDAHDKSEHMKALQAIQESEESYRELFHGMNETIWIIDLEGDLIDMNRTAIDTLGYSKEELLEIGLFGIDTTLNPEIIKSFVKTMPIDKVQKFETTHKTKDGRIFPVEIYSSLITYFGKKAILSIAREITDRKRAEEAQKTRMNELELFHKLTVGRELTMIDLKKEVNDLLIELGRQEKYKVVK